MEAQNEFKSARIMAGGCYEIVDRNPVGGIEKNHEGVKRKGRRGQVAGREQ